MIDFIILFASIYLLAIGLMMKTSGWSFAFAFKILPVLMGVTLFAHSLSVFGVI